MSSRKSALRLTAGELKVMQLLWTYGEMKPSEIQQKFPQPIRNPALRSFLTILLEKEHVSRRRDGRAYYYKARTPQKKVFGSMLSELTEAFCNGSTRQLILNLVREEQLTDEDLKELRRVAESDQESQ